MYKDEPVWVLVITGYPIDVMTEAEEREAEADKSPSDVVLFDSKDEALIWLNDVYLDGDEDRWLEDVIGCMSEGYSVYLAPHYIQP